MENVTKAIIIGASIVITLAIVTIGFTIYGIGRDASDKATEKLEEWLTVLWMKNMKIP